jgi:uncharacterized protein YndB with AHSA1/START domain
MSEAGTYVVERRRSMTAPPSAVFERIVDLRRWQAWSPWEDLDPQLRRSYTGSERGVGSVYQWAGNRKAGTGHMEITSVEPDRSVTIALQFLKPFRSSSTVQFELQPEGAGTAVTWRMTGAKTLMTKVMGLFTSMDKMMGPDFDKGLDRLKAQVESSS